MIDRLLLGGSENKLEWESSTDLPESLRLAEPSVIGFGLACMVYQYSLGSMISHDLVSTFICVTLSHAFMSLQTR